MNLQALHCSTEAVEEVAEEYLLGHLSSSDLATFEEHLITCDQCRQAVTDAEQFITLFRSAVNSSPWTQTH